MTARLSGGASAPVWPLIFDDMLPHKRGTEGEEDGNGMTWLRPACPGATLQDGACDLTRRQLVLSTAMKSAFM